jgi:L-fucose isomerase
MFTGAFMDINRDKEEQFGSDTSPEWPHVFARFDCDFDDFVQQFSSNHIHAAVGNWLGEMKAACEALDIEPIVMS